MEEKRIINALKCVEKETIAFSYDKEQRQFEYVTGKELLDLIHRQKAEIERLTVEIDQRREMMHRMDCNYATELQKNAELQKQVDELNDLQFTKEHCDLYKENKWLKECLQQAVKDTAKEIYEKAKAKSISTFVNIDDNPRKDSSIFLSDLKNIVREKVVEVE